MRRLELIKLEAKEKAAAVSGDVLLTTLYTHQHLQQQQGTGHVANSKNNEHSCTWSDCCVTIAVHVDASCLHFFPCKPIGTWLVK